MRHPARQAASRANGARSSMDALSLHLLAKTTVDDTLCIASRDPVEATCSAIQSSPDDLDCLVPAGKNPRLHALRQTCEKKGSRKPPPRKVPRGSRPLGRMAARTVRRSLYPCASGHTSRSRGLQPANRKNLRLRHPKKTQEKPKETQEKPKKTQEKPTETQENPTTPAEHPLPAAGVFLVVSREETAVSDASGHTGPPPALTAHPPGVAMVRMNEVYPACRGEPARTFTGTANRPPELMFRCSQTIKLTARPKAETIR